MGRTTVGSREWQMAVAAFFTFYLLLIHFLLPFWFFISERTTGVFFPSCQGLSGEETGVCVTPRFRLWGQKLCKWAIKCLSLNKWIAAAICRLSRLSSSLWPCPPQMEESPPIEESAWIFKKVLPIIHTLLMTTLKKYEMYAQRLRRDTQIFKVCVMIVNLRVFFFLLLLLGCFNSGKLF